MKTIIAYLAVLRLCSAALYFSVVLMPKDIQHTHEMLKAVGQLAGGWQWLIILSVVILAPVAEELFFRGLLQSMLRKYLNRPWLSILLTSIAFALIHQPLWHTMPALFVLSLAIGYNYERCGRLLPAILIHSFFNAVFIAEAIWWSAAS